MDRITGRSFATRSEVLARGGMAATSQPLATQAALEILRAGGSAVDAALAANAVLCVTEPTGASIGGDLFAIVWDAEKRRLEGLNGSGRSPRELHRDWLVGKGLTRIPAVGPLCVTVPGCVDAWYRLHERWGELPMPAVLAPAIRYAREGFPVSELVAHEWAENAERLGEFEGFRQQFLREGRAPRKGEVFKNPNLARTLEALAAEGREWFYRGPIAEVVEKAFDELGGFLCVEDFAEHRSDWVDPVSTHYRGYEVFELPPNGQGIAALQILNLLEFSDLKSLRRLSPEYLHLFVEAKKLVYEDRARWYADPEFVQIPVAELISKEYARRRADLIDPWRAAASYEPGNPALEDGDTVYLATADAAGNMVSLIQSNFRGMGSGVAPPGLGFVLQSRGELFDLKPGRYNTYEPGKRPFHTIIPAFVLHDGAPFLCFGAMGGATQPQAHAQIVANIVDFKMNLQEAGDAPRLVHTGSSDPTGVRMKTGGQVFLESGFPYESVRGLIERGHQVGWARGGFGGYQAIGYDPATGVFRGASDSRKDGLAAGF
jgi:gamma-glutamyltranspeptidase / glutathione hydrolase